MTDLSSAGVPSQTAAQARQALVDSLPFPVKLTSGELHGSTELKGWESDMRKTDAGEGLLKNKTDQEQAIYNNLDAFIDETGARTSSDSLAGGEILSYLKGAEKDAKGKVSESYKVARESDEGLRQVVPNELADYINANIHSAESAPVLNAIRQQMRGNGFAVDDLSNPLKPNAITAKPMNLHEIEKGIRETLSNEARTGSTNGHHAREMKKIVDKITDETGGDLYKQSRQMHRGYAEEFKGESTAARMLAKVGKSDRQRVSAERMARKIAEEPAVELEKFKNLLTGGGEKGVQTWNEVQGRMLAHIKEGAERLTPKNAAGQSQVSAAGIGKLIKKLDKESKLELIFGVNQSEQLRALVDLMEGVMTLPTGIAGNSGTPAALMRLMQHAPIVKYLMSPVKTLKENAKIKASLNPNLTGIRNETRASTPYEAPERPVYEERDPTAKYVTQPLPRPPSPAPLPPEVTPPKPKPTLALPTREKSLQGDFDARGGETIRFKADGSEITRAGQYQRYIEDGKTPDEARTLVEADVINNKGRVSRVTPTKPSGETIRLGSEKPPTLADLPFTPESAKKPTLIGKDGRVMQFATENEAADFIKNNGLSDTHSTGFAYGQNIVKLNDKPPTLAEEVKGEPKSRAQPKPQPINHEKDNILSAIRKLGGIDKGMYEKTYGDTRGLKERGINGVFRSEGGKSIDDLQSQLRSEGYLTPDGDVHELGNLLYDHNVRESFSNRKVNYDHLSPVETEAQTLPDKPKFQKPES